MEFLWQFFFVFEKKNVYVSKNKKTKFGVQKFCCTLLWHALWTGFQNAISSWFFEKWNLFVQTFSITCFSICSVGKKSFSKTFRVNLRRRSLNKNKCNLNLILHNSHPCGLSGWCGGNLIFEQNNRVFACYPNFQSHLLLYKLKMTKR